VFDGQPLGYFQPFIDTSTGRIAGIEALGRLSQADGSLQAVGSLARLESFGIAPERIVFEITELSGDDQHLKEVVAHYRDAGARIGIDDFGAGHSQLDRVLALQPDILKLDLRLFQAAARGALLLPHARRTLA
jgi:EAL domain-containing protein (putative c-di-GMP-specific phosphodiesterase class I)